MDTQNRTFRFLVAAVATLVIISLIVTAVQ